MNNNHITIVKIGTGNDINHEIRNNQFVTNIHCGCEFFIYSNNNNKSFIIKNRINKLNHCNNNNNSNNNYKNYKIELYKQQKTNQILCIVQKLNTFMSSFNRYDQLIYKSILNDTLILLKNENPSPYDAARILSESISTKQSSIYFQPLFQEFLDLIVIYSKIHIKKLFINICERNILWISTNNILDGYEYIHNSNSSLINYNRNIFDIHYAKQNTLENPASVLAYAPVAPCTYKNDYFYAISINIGYSATERIIKYLECKLNTSKFIPNELINIIKQYQIKYSIHIHYNDRDGVWTQMRMFHKSDIIQVQSGNNSVLFLDSNGKLFIKNLQKSIPTIKKELKCISSIKCGYQDNMALNLDGKLLCWNAANYDWNEGRIDFYKNAKSAYFRNRRITNFECGSTYLWLITNKKEHFIIDYHNIGKCINNILKQYININNDINVTYNDMSGNIVLISWDNIQNNNILKYKGTIRTNQYLFNTIALQLTTCKMQSNLLNKNLIIQNNNKYNHNKYIGICKRYFIEKRYGFITMNDAMGDIFVHYSDINSTNTRMKLEMGTYVEFNIIKQNGRRRAINVRVINHNSCNY